MKSLLLLLPPTLTALALANVPSAPFTPADPVPGSHRDVHGQLQRDHLAQRRHADPNVPSPSVTTPESAVRPYDRAMQQWSQIPRAVPGTPGSSVGIATGSVWTPIGPSPTQQDTFPGLERTLNGAVSSIAIHPFNSSVLYLGAVGGGVWRTTDAGLNWRPLFDQQPSLGIGQPSAIAIDPSNPSVLFVGTSRLENLGNSSGLFYSVNGGANWTNLGSGFPAFNTGTASQFLTGRDIAAILVDPASSARVYLGDNTGVYRSIDAGANWDQGTGLSGNVQSLVLDSTSRRNGRALYAGVNEQGIFKSIDSGVSWTLALDANSPLVLSEFPPPPAGGTGPFAGKVVVAMAPPTSPPANGGIQVHYATIQGFSLDDQGVVVNDEPAIFRSIDAGATWTARTATGIGSCFCNQSMELAVDPASPGDGENDVLVWAGTDLFRSTNSGASFSDISNGQAQHHIATPTFFKRDGQPSLLYTGNFGGIWRSRDNGANWTGSGVPGELTSINEGGLQVALMRNIDVRSFGQVEITMGAFFGGGIARSDGNPTEVEWRMTRGGNGSDIVVAGVPGSPRAFHSGGRYGPPNCTRVFRSSDRGETWPDEVTPPGFDPGCFEAPLAASVTNLNEIYACDTTRVWQSADAGATWRELFAGEAPRVDVAQVDGNSLVIASGGQVLVTQDALAATPTITNITRNLPGATVTRVAFDPIDPTTIYAVLGGFGTPHVFRTTIASNGWSDISAPVDVPHNAIAIDGNTLPPTIYVGTDLGVLRSVDGGDIWTVLDDIHLPNVPVTDLHVTTIGGRLRAATFGRGAFQFTFPDGPVIAANAVNGLAFENVCVNTSSTLLLQVFNVGTENLVINSVQRLVGSSAFSVLANPSTPLVIQPGSEVDFSVRYAPTFPGISEQALIRISSNDPDAPFFDLMATGASATGHIVTKIANSGSFGNVCRGEFRDLDLTLQNSGLCDLTVSEITSDNARFVVANVTSFPIVLAHGTSVVVPIRFTGAEFGPAAAMITVTSDDPSHTPPGFVQVAVSADTPPPDIEATGSTDFGQVCPDELAEKVLTICNLGLCKLNVLDVDFDPACSDFTIVNNPFPPSSITPIFPSDCVPVTIRYTPTGVGTHTCNLRIRSDDPDELSLDFTVTGITPASMLDVQQPDVFPATVIQSVAECESTQPLLVTNTGKCPVTVTDVNITQDPADPLAFELIGLPSFPVTLLPGQSLGGNGAKIVFHPHLLAYNIAGTLNVEFVDNDPLMGDVGLITRSLCGDGVKTGARVLVTKNGVPISNLTALKLFEVVSFGPPLLLNLVTHENGLPVQTNTVSCLAPFQWHAEWGTEFNPQGLTPGNYLIEARNGNDLQKLNFHVEVCDFLPDLVIDF